jgi:nucleotide-binding universal stress UspA family protein
MEEDIKRILVVSRITKNCRAIHCGISLARKYGAELTIVHIVHNPFGLEGWNVPMMSLEKEYENMLEEAKADLEEIIMLEKGKGLPIKKLIREGEPTKEILKVVNEENTDLLIACHDEESRLEHFLFCRNNEELIRQMPCSIMLVKNELTPPLW